MRRKIEGQVNTGSSPIYMFSSTLDILCGAVGTMALA